MKSGPHDTDTPSLFDGFINRFSSLNLGSKATGAVASTLLEMTIFHGGDTYVKNVLNSFQSKAALLYDLRSASLYGKIQRLYQGFPPALFKKGPQRAQKWLTQDAAKTALNQYEAWFVGVFGEEYAKTAIAATAGAAAGMTEPLLVQPLDTKQVMAQNNKKTSFRALGFTGAYRAALITGVFRNTPGSIALFGGSEWFNQLAGNHDHHSASLDFLAKWFGATVSTVVSQPGDVIKTQMQTNQIGFIEAFSKLSAKELFTNGIGPRVVFASSKVAFGFFAYQRLTAQFEKFFNGHAESASSSATEQLEGNAQQMLGAALSTEEAATFNWDACPSTGDSFDDTLSFFNEYRRAQSHTQSSVKAENTATASTQHQNTMKP